jgi:hypothetical protein
MGEPVGVDACSVDPDAVITARVETSRDIRLLAGGLTALPVGVAGPTAAVALGVAFAIVVPFGIGLFLFPPVGLALWLRSSVATLVTEARETTSHQRLDDPERGKRLIEELNR